LKRRRAFLDSVAKLDDNVVYLCFSQARGVGRGRGGKGGWEGGREGREGGGGKGMR
jgi:hypothetical protein